MTVAMERSDIAMAKPRRSVVARRGDSRPWTFYALATVFTLYVAACMAR